jgi:phosphate:Na+ symporter
LLFYFGLIFFGLDLIRQASSPLKESQAFGQIFTQTKNPLFGLGLGMVVTAVVQASAIPIGILAVLAQQDLILLDNAVPIVLGANIGTTVTALLAGTVANASGKRTAVSHLVFKCAGVFVCILILPFFLDTLKGLSDSVAQQIAWAHFLLNLIIVVLFIFFLRPFSALMKKVLPGVDETLPIWPEYINSKDLVNPVKSLEQVYKELQRQGRLVQIMYSQTIRLMADFDEGRRRDIAYIEMAVKNMRMQIVKFLWRVSGRQLSEPLSKRVFAYTALTSDIQSIGSHIQSMSVLTTQKAGRGIHYSATGEREFQEVAALVGRNLADAVTLLEIYNPEIVRDVLRREDVIDGKVRESLSNHLKRFHLRQCSPEAGPIFVEMMGHLERVSDLCNNVAEYVRDLQ